MRGRLILVRHGTTPWIREGRFQGHLDPPLAPDGHLEAQLLANRLLADGLRPARLVSSPLARARETAEAVVVALAASRSAIELELDPRLMEIGQGDWEGRSHAELTADDAERYAAWKAQPGYRVPPGGEPIEDAYRRVSAVLSELLASTRSWPLCIVSHGGALRLAARYLLEIETPRAWAMDMDNAGLSVLDPTDDGWQIVHWNDIGHLLGRETPHHVPQGSAARDF